MSDRTRIGARGHGSSVWVPHLATAAQPKPAFAAMAERPPHPATVVQDKGLPPHPATVVRGKGLPPHPATTGAVQRRGSAVPPTRPLAAGSGTGSPDAVARTAQRAAFGNHNAEDRDTNTTRASFEGIHQTGTIWYRALIAEIPGDADDDWAADPLRPMRGFARSWRDGDGSYWRVHGHEEDPGAHGGHAGAEYSTVRVCVYPNGRTNPAEYLMAQTIYDQNLVGDIPGTGREWRVTTNARFVGASHIMLLGY